MKQPIQQKVFEREEEIASQQFEMMMTNDDLSGDQIESGVDDSPLILTAREREILEREPEEIVPPSNFLLDSWHIHRTGWKAMAEDGNFRPYMHQPPPRAANSEANTPALVDLPQDTMAEDLFLHDRDWVTALTKVPNNSSPSRLFGLAAAKHAANVISEVDMKGALSTPISIIR